MKVCLIQQYYKVRIFSKKPFDKRQLLIAMVMAVAKNMNETNTVHMLNGFSYYFDSQCLYFENHEVELTRTERRLLYLLLIHRNHTISFGMIETYVWQTKGASPDTIRNYINRLRAKIYPELIKNIQGVGYQITLN